MSIPDELRNIRDHLRSGRFGQREVWEQQLEQAAVEVERLQADAQHNQSLYFEARDEIERLTAIVKAHEADNELRYFGEIPL